MATSDLKAGDIVRLKTDGPRMVVNGFSEVPDGVDDRVTCIWFDGDKLRSEDICSENLLLVEAYV